MEFETNTTEAQQGDGPLFKIPGETGNDLCGMYDMFKTNLS